MVGIAVGAAGWAVFGPEKTADTRTSPAVHASPAKRPATTAGARHYASAQDIADALDKAGFTVSMLHKDTESTYITQVGGTAYDFTVTDKAGQPAAGDSGINMFPNQQALAAWAELSKSMGGIAVTGDTWAVSLATGSDQARADSQRLAPRIAQALGGSVQR
ncbi:hypothetical protein GCM10010389_46130 [Streptomyces echinoruber]|uniref:Uncharacterized protein n=1 Tax=Streptomyces echinoruber TaxID=68898 RepID=A0A918VJS5_9ACTN|nr:hypothetical protein GCM10010389_46130 [Streptomyces echinoruber]